MGCTQSLKDKKRPKQQKIFKREAKKPNPYLTITAKDIYSFKATWKTISRSLEETGKIMFTK